MESVFYIGIMSGTSLDGVDAVLADFQDTSPALLQTFFLPYDNALKKELLALHQPGNDELHRAAILANQLSHCYAQAVTGLLKGAGVNFKRIAAIGCHGQTIRHCPEKAKGYTIQLVNSALLAELTGISVVSDFRSRDIAAGGQGAPLVPAFHQTVFMHTSHPRVIVNIGGIANITRLNSRLPVMGFDSGPGNLLMDAWCSLHTGRHYDDNGYWAASGCVISTLLDALLADSYFERKPPKSTGREWFNLEWLEQKISGNEPLEDVQATLLELTVRSIAAAIVDYCPDTEEIYVCGGGAHNAALMRRLAGQLPDRRIEMTDSLGVAADWVEAFAFAWLARRTLLRETGNLAAVTGASGDRILGAIYPA